MTRWEQVFDLWQEGYSIPEIAGYLGITVSQGWTELATAQAYEQREQARSAWERLADGLAAVYPDDARKNWIYLQMGVERRDERSACGDDPPGRTAGQGAR